MIFLRYYLAIDIGASSGRHIVGWRENKKIRTEEVYRFPNGVLKENGHLVWDVRKLFSNVVMGIMESFKVYPEIESLSIDKDLYALEAASAPMKQHGEKQQLGILRGVLLVLAFRQQTDTGTAQGVDTGDVCVF